MKLYILILSLLLPLVDAMGQCPEDKLFDWTDKTNSNWQGYVNSTTPYPMLSPFVNTNDALNDIEAAKDYTKGDGWILMKKNFGCPQGYQAYPYFILYNKYRSILRIYIFNPVFGQPIATGAVITLEFNGSAQYSALLNHTKAVSAAYDKYPNAGSEDLGVTNLERNDPGKWMVGEFPIAFDPAINTLQTQIVLRVNSVTSSGVNTVGTFQIDTDLKNKNFGIASTKQEKNNTQTLSEYTANGAKALKQLPSYDEYKKKMQDFANNVPFTSKDTSAQNIFNYLKQGLTQLSQDPFISTVLGGAVGLGKFLDGASKVFNFFTGAVGTNNSTSTPTNTFQPLLSYGTINLQGTITTQPDLTSVTLQAPGSDYFILTEDAKPYFDCPMGVITLANTPFFSTLNANLFFGTAYGAYYEGSGLGVYSYKLQNDIGVSINGATSNIMDLGGIDACIVFKIKNNPCLTYYEEYRPSYYYSNDPVKVADFIGLSKLPSIVNVRGVLLNPVTGNVSDIVAQQMPNPFSGTFTNGTYILENYDKDEEVYTIRTQYRSLSCMLNTAVTLPQGSAIVGLKLRAVFNRKDNGKPVIHMATYKCDFGVPGNINNSVYAFSASQSGTDFINTAESYPLVSSTNSDNTPYKFSAIHVIQSADMFAYRPDINNQHSYTYEAGDFVELLPGFEVQAGVDFTAQIQSFACGTDNITTVATACHYTPIGSPRIGHFTDNVEKIATVPLENSFNAYPNPFSNEVTLHFNLEKATRTDIVIYNNLTQVVLTLTESFEAGEHELTKQFDNLAAGVYTICFKAGDYVSTQKIVKMQ